MKDYEYIAKKRILPQTPAIERRNRVCSKWEIFVLIEARLSYLYALEVKFSLGIRIRWSFNFYEVQYVIQITSAQI